MLVNKRNFLAIGVPKPTASRYILMLGRRMASKLINPPLLPHGQGRIPTRGFELEYAIKMSNEMTLSLKDRVHIDEWTSLYQALTVIKKEKREWPKPK